jgi:outer membrane immunogenic protein
MPSRMRIALKGIGAQTLRSSLIGRVVSIAALLSGMLAAQATAQQNSPDKVHFGPAMVGVTYDLERAKIAGTGCGCFWLQGGSAEIALPFYKGFGVAGSFSGDHASNIRPGVDLNKLSYVAGPRYTFDALRTPRGAGVQIFGEALFGGVHGFGSIFPVNGGVAPTANSYAMRIGGGMDIALHNALVVRAFEVDYVRTGLPNGGTNTQNDLRLAFGLFYRFRKR